MAGAFGKGQTRFRVWRFMAGLRAARDFGLDEATANTIALDLDPKGRNADCLLDQLAAALIEENALQLPRSV